MNTKRLICFFVMLTIFSLMCYESYGQEAAEENSNQVKFKSVAAGNGYSVALKEDGTVIALGYNQYDD